MTSLWPHWPWLLAMGGLIACSAFFSGSEAALFSLRWPDRCALSIGSPSQQVADRLLRDPDRLLSSVLFWNLMINVVYFSIASVVGLALKSSALAEFSRLSLSRSARWCRSLSWEKCYPRAWPSLDPRAFASWVGLPLAATVRIVDPVMPWLRAVNRISRRIVWPSAAQEQSLDVADLERAIELSQPNRALAEQEEVVLRKLIGLSELEVQEWMRPRSHIKAFHPPVSLEDLVGAQLDSDVLLITEPDSDEIVSAIPLWEIQALPVEHVERMAREVLVVPWCTRVADAFEQMHRNKNTVCVVVNELGESLGILTLLDILDTVFSPHHHRSDRLLRRTAVHESGTGLVAGVGNDEPSPVGDGCFSVQLPPTRNVTMGGVVYELLERAPERDDCLRWGDLAIRVLRTGSPSELLLEVQSHASEPEVDA